MTQYFSFTFFLFLIVQRNFFPLRLRHQTSATKLRYLRSSAFSRQPLDIIRLEKASLDNLDEVFLYCNSNEG